MKIKIILTILFLSAWKPSFADGIENLIQSLKNDDVAEFKTRLDNKKPISDKELNTLLVLSVISNQPAKASFLVSSKNVNRKIKSGITPLMLASGRGSAELVQLLLDNGADVNLTDEDGSNAIIYAAFNNNSAVIDNLINANVDVNAKNLLGTMAIHFFSSEGNLGAVKKLIKSGAKYQLEDAFGDTPYSLCKNEVCAYLKQEISKGNIK